MSKISIDMNECPFGVAMNMVSGKWKLLILWHLTKGAIRFVALQRLLPNITQKTLTQQLRELETDGLISRSVYAEVPPKVEYSLTPLGESIRPVLQELCRWGKAYQSRGFLGI